MEQHVDLVCPVCGFRERVAPDCILGLSLDERIRSRPADSVSALMRKEVRHSIRRKRDMQ